MSNTKVMSLNNHWMYPLENMYRHINTFNFPITRTISIIINSNNKTKEKLIFLIIQTQMLLNLKEITKDNMF